MNRPLRNLFVFFVFLFGALVVQLTYIQVWAAPDLSTHQANTRALREQMRVERGVIVSADGIELAVNRKEGPYFLRSYPLGDLTAPWLGYTSLRYGQAGLERVYNLELAGEADILQVRNYLDVFTGRPRRGADLHLTVDTRVQEAAVSALGGRSGAVVALDPRSGRIIAMASSPRYDPNALEEDWESLSAGSGRPFVNRALTGLYPPGSVFKTVVGAAALQDGVVERGTEFVDEGSFLAGGFRVSNYGGSSYGEHDFETALVRSINTTFAKVGVELGAGPLVGYSREFGFGREVPGLRLDVALSPIPDAGALDTAHLAQISFGQGELLSTPLQMALVAAGIGNQGTIMRPYLVDEIRDYRQTVLSRTEPEEWLSPVSAEAAATMTDLMIEVVRGGTGTAAALPGVNVAGKTGTAETEAGGGNPHAWFICFAPAEDPRVAVGVVVEHGGTGGAVAAPIARAVVQAALAASG